MQNKGFSSNLVLKNVRSP